MLHEPVARGTCRTGPSHPTAGEQTVKMASHGGGASLCSVRDFSRRELSASFIGQVPHRVHHAGPARRTDGLGAIRKKVVNISDTTYVPMQVPAILEEMLESVITKARLVKNPIEAAFFLWVNLAYLQPFEDGNKRTSRLAANIPLMLYNCAPLSFMDVDPQDYARAMLGVYEFRDVSLAVDLFAWTYRRSMKKYVVVLESMGAPDPLRLRYRESLNDAIGLVVRERKPLQAVLPELGLMPEVAPGFEALLRDELRKLEVFNCARYKLTMAETQAWIASGRPQ